jgi:hypothetical protein
MSYDCVATMQTSAKLTESARINLGLHLQSLHPGTVRFFENVCYQRRRLI